MDKIRVLYYGHSCFALRTGGGSVVLDPYEDGSVPGLRLPRGLIADAVYCSHDHSDHNAAQLVGLTGRPAPFPVSYLTVPHDDADGRKRGLTKLTFISACGITVAHLGDIGRLPTAEEYRKLQTADVVMLPCGGYYTIDLRQALELIRNLRKPCLKILMHYRDGSRGYEVLSDISDIQRTIPGVKRLQNSYLDITAGKAVPDEIVTLEPAQD